VLRTRLLTAAVALPTLLAAIFFLPDWAFTLMVGVFGLWGLYEIREMMRDGVTGQESSWSLFAFAAVILLGYLVDHNRGWILPVIVIVLMTFLVGWVATFGAQSLSKDLNLALIGYGSVFILFPFFALLRNGPNGIELFVLMLLLVILADTGAYFVGRAIGRHKLAFKVSPGKTIEGAIGGIIASIAGGLVLRWWLVPQWSPAGMIAFAAMVAILAIIGDLANSAFKRVAGVKDSGWIFPGHGGLLDRTCSLVFAAVLTYYYSR
jgi:phosphatidate cytidylyltransferase